MYKIEKINDNSYKDIQSLYLLSFGFKDSINSIKLKYDTSKFGLKNLGVLAKDKNNEPVAFYGLIPTLLNYNSTNFMIAQSADAMTAPNHQGKGLFTRLGKEAHKLSVEKGIKTIFAFPDKNKNSYPVFKHKLEWEFNRFMKEFTVKVKTVPLCELSSKLPILRPLYNRYVKLRISKYKVELNEISLDSFNFSNVKGRIKKDICFFEYKIRREGVFLVNVDGFSLLIKAKTHLYIGEVSKIEKEQIKPLIKSIKRLSRRLGCRKAIFTLSENHWMYDFLREEILPEESLAIGFYLIDKTINPNEIQFTGADYDTF